jgi:predicted phosphodiesterase
LFGLVYIPDDYTVIAVTDIHGDIYALEAAIGEFEAKKRETERVAFVCMGDFVDRGEYNFEVVKRLFELKRKYQDEVIILKGDHEDDAYIQEKDGIYVHIDSADFLELLGEAQQIKISIPRSDRVLIRTKLAVEEKVRELYNYI